MSDLFALLAFGLLVAGVVGSVVPAMPGAPLSVFGVLGYWWQSGYAEPDTLLLVGLVLVGLLTWAVDLGAGALAAKVGGASTTTALVAGLVGFALFFVAGPVGIIAGVAGTVFLLEFRRSEDAEASAKTAAVTTIGLLGSAVVQVLLTASILLVMVWVALG